MAAHAELRAGLAGLTRAARAVWGVRAELLVAAAATAGWALLTWAVATLTVWQAWPISAGLFLLALCGVRFLATVAGYGLYALSQGDAPAPRPRSTPRA